MTINDLALLVFLFIFIVLLVNHYLGSAFLTKNLRFTAIAGGWAWLVYSCLGEDIR